MISTTISTTTTGLLSHGHAPQNLVLVENLGILLLNLKLLMSTVLWTAVTCISSLLSLIVLILKKLVELLTLTAKQVWNVLCILCRWAAGAKNITSMFKKSQTYAWKKDGGLHPDYTSVSSETHGVHKNSQLEKAMKAPIDQDAIRKAGW